MTADVVVIGAGTVGAAVAYGLAVRGMSVLALDGEDTDFRASNANFGLVWLHGKGMDMPAYQHLSSDAVDLWPALAEQLQEETRTDLQYERNGGLVLCLGEERFERREAELLRLHNQLGASGRDWEMLRREDLARLLPNVRLGPEVVGASFGHRDGHANPLRLLTALRAGLLMKGGQLRTGHPVHAVRPVGGGYEIEFGAERVSAGRVVIAAGLGSRKLAADLGLTIPIRPQRGQILVTERMAPFLPLPTLDVRQTREGTVMMGATNEEAGYDSSATVEAAAGISANALRQMPALGEAKLVRQWAGLRILTPDGFPIYAQSETHPGVFLATCHSGVTLVPTHAGVFAEGVAAGRLPASLDVFHQRRFDVPKAA